MNQDNIHADFGKALFADVQVPKSNLQPNRYQEEIFSFVKNSEAVLPFGGNAVVNAVAGSGKTTTIVRALEHIPIDRRVLFCAFNKHIAEELTLRAPVNVRSTTLNSFGFQSVREHKNYRVKAEKTMDILWFDVFRKTERPFYLKIRNSVARVISLLKGNLIGTPLPSHIEAIVEDQGLLIEAAELERFIDICLQTFNYAVDTTRFIIDFDDQLYYPALLKLPIPKHDFVFVDEAQDLNLAQMWLIEQAAHGSIIAVGDTNQAIYGFRGARIDAINHIAEMYNACTLPLSICYRCAKNIVREAQPIVPQIEYSESSPEGLVDRIGLDKYDSLLSDGDWVLCRTTSPLVDEALRLIRQKRKAIVKGRNIGEALLQMLEYVDDLDEYEHQVSERYINREAQLAAILDQIATLRALLAAYGRENIYNGVREVFAEETKGVTFCTIHRAKGLETDRVFLICPELLPHPKSTNEWQIKQEMNLKYIAITRAKREFYYVEGISTNKER